MKLYFPSGLLGNHSSYKYPLCDINASLIGSEDRSCVSSLLCQVNVVFVLSIVIARPHNPADSISSIISIML